jgi:hypothetical protein
MDDDDDERRVGGDLPSLWAEWRQEVAFTFPRPFPPCVSSFAHRPLSEE